MSKAINTNNSFSYATQAKSINGKVEGRKSNINNLAKNYLFFVEL